MDTRTDADWVTDYLEEQASRAVITDTFDDIVSGTSIIHVYARADDRRRSPWTYVAAAAALVAVVGVGVALTSRRAEPTPINAATAPPPGEGGAGTAPPDTTAAQEASVPETSIVPTTAPPVEAYPLGGIWLGGQQPYCTAIDATSYACTLPQPFHGDVPNYDDTGYALEYSSDDGLVTGGCRAVNSVASVWTCYVGERAVQEQIIAEGFLGDTVGTQFIAG